MYLYHCHVAIFFLTLVNYIITISQCSNLEHATQIITTYTISTI